MGKLTLLLSESLQCARTFLLATVSPALSSFDETVATLRLAQAVRQITTKSRCGNFREAPRSLNCTGSEPAPPVVNYPEDVLESSVRQSFAELQPAQPIPFAPRLSSWFSDDESYSPNRSDEICEVRPMRFRLDAWKVSNISSSACSTVAADSRAPTEFGDSDRSMEESRNSICDDCSCMVSYVVQAPKLTDQQLYRHCWN